MKTDMQQAAENARRQLGELSELSAKSDAAERKILEAAEKRQEWVSGQIAELRPRALLENEASDRYQALVEERAKLDIVIAQAKRHLAPRGRS